MAYFKMVTMGIILLKVLLFYKEYCIPLQKITFSRGQDHECDRMFLNGRPGPKRRLVTTFNCNPFHGPWDFVIRELESGFWLLLFRLFTKHLNPRWNLNEHSFFKATSIIGNTISLACSWIRVYFVSHLLW